MAEIREDQRVQAIGEIEDFLTTTIGIGRLNPEAAFSPDRIERYEALMKKWFPKAWAFFREKEL